MAVVCWKWRNVNCTNVNYKYNIILSMIFPSFVNEIREDWWKDRRENREQYCVVFRQTMKLLNCMPCWKVLTQIVFASRKHCYFLPATLSIILKLINRFTVAKHPRRKSLPLVICSIEPSFRFLFLFLLYLFISWIIKYIYSIWPIYHQLDSSLQW